VVTILPEVLRGSEGLYLIIYALAVTNRSPADVLHRGMAYVLQGGTCSR
jgi:hypothetical protein